MLLCDNKANGDVVPFVRIFSDDCVTDLTVNGAPYAVMGAVAPCTEDQQDGCDTTTPVTTVSLCLADGTPIAVVMQRDCDGVVSAPGWVNLTSGVYTAGVVPAGAAPCDASVAAMATGLTLADGTPITVVSQRDSDGLITQTGWINAVTGVFTPGPPPGTTRAPGDAEPDLAVLCDTTPDGAVTSFVRNYERNRAGDVVGFADHTLTGAPYVPTGTVAACDAVSPCDATTPVSTTGLCLADGTPIATVAQRDCDGVITQTGWINLRTGVYTVGLPPAGTTTCTSESVQLSGVLCDVDPGTGDVFALVLVEYHYAPDGSIESVRLVRASDGSTYALQGELSICPDTGAAMDVEIVCMSDYDGAGFNLRFFRHFVYNADGTVASTFDTTWDGTPYVVTATAIPCDMQNINTSTQVLCDDNGPFVRVYVTRNEIETEDASEAQATSYELTLDANPYEAVGTVGVCGPATVDVETEPLCLIDASGVLISQVVAEYGFDGATGARTFTRYLDPTTGAAVTPPAGATVRECDAPCCPEPICYAGSGPGEMCQPGVLQELPTLDPTITSASVVANPNGFTVNALGSSHNGTTTGDWTTITLDAAGAAPGLVLRYNFGGPADIAQIRLFNNYGSDLGDLDGIGAATLTVYDAADTVLFTGPLNAGNGGVPFDTPFGGGLLTDATYFTLSDIVRQPTSNVTQLGWREIQGIGSYRALITWECPDETISALVEGPLAGITYDGANIVQTNPPHTFTFSSSAGAFEATLVTDNPGAWTSTQVTTDNPVTVLSASASLTVEAVPELARGIASGLLHPDGTVTDTNTGELVVDPVIVPCVAVREPDHVQTAHILDLCEAGTPFLRQVRVTRDGNVQVIDTEIDGRTAYIVVNEGAVTAGPCVRDRLGEVCTEAGPLLAPSSAVGFSQNGDCWVTTAASPDLTYTGAIDSLEFTVEGGLAGGPSFSLILDGATTLLGAHFTPPIPTFPTAVDSYHGTATVGGITVTADIVDGALALANGGSGEFGLAGRMRFAFSPQLTSVQINASWPNFPDLAVCDVVILPSTAPNPTQLVAFRSGDGTVTYYAADGTEVESPVLLPCGTCCTGEPAPFAAATASAAAPSPVRARVRTVTAGSEWTPAEATGVVTSVAATGVSGTWSVTDENGTVAAGLTASTTLRWDADGGDLIPPATIAADPDSTVAVTWTQR